MNHHCYAAATLLAACAVLPACAQSSTPSRWAELAEPVSLAMMNNTTRLLREPAGDGDHIVFVYANDIWITDHDGGDARRLTTFDGAERNPHLSPDGTRVCFTGQYDGNTDVYVVDINGGSPRRLTWHPGADVARGWTPDGSAVVFISARDTAPIPINRFWTIGLDDAMPEAMPIPRGWDGHFDDSGRYFAYQPMELWDIEWRNYRGGQNRPIWILDLETLDLDMPEWEDSRDTDPVWLNGDLYFISDRNWTANIWRYTPGSNSVEQVTFHTEFDVKNLETAGDALVYENAGFIRRLDPATEQDIILPVTVRGDFPWKRPHWQDVGGQLQNGSLSPTGKRAVFEARGEIITVPVKDGNWRNMTRSTASAERAPAWSPDGAHIAWVSDASGEYQLIISPQDGLGETRTIDIANPTFFYNLQWSPDSSKIMFTDEAREIHVVDVESGDDTIIDGDTYCVPGRSLNPVWSPCSQWIAYSKRLDSQIRAIFAHSLETGETHQLTDGLSDATSPAWDRSGKYLYFLASTNVALTTGWLDMSSYDKTVTRGVYVMVLQDDVESPFAPRSDEEPVEEKPEESEDDATAEAEAEGADAEEAEAAEEEESEEESTATRIDFDHIDQRILAIPVPERNYSQLQAGPDGIIFYAEVSYELGSFGQTLHQYNLNDRDAKTFLSGINGYSISSDGSKMLYNGRGTWGVISTAAPSSVGQGALSTGGVRIRINPPDEWRQIFTEAWRFHRDFFYVDNHHGADWDAVYERWSPLVDHVSHRADLSHLMDVVGGEIAVGHSFTGGGDTPNVANVNIGLLGADIEAANGKYRIATILRGENWNPNLRAPLSQPGLDINEGDYILAIDGHPIDDTENFYSMFEGTAGRQITLDVNSEPTMEGSRRVTVVPLGNETALRQREWMESNRRKVDAMSDGKLAYVWLPNTGGGGYTNFNRYYFAQQDRHGAVVDERFNGGGSAADYMVDIMDRELHGFFNNPIGDRKMWTQPISGIWGPKVMVINESAGSGGDLLPYLFRAKEIGPLVGTRTWGGLVGIWDYPVLIDGGVVTIPRGGFVDLDGVWDVENVGVAPDIEVEITPRDFINGSDPQLERAVQEALRLLNEGARPTILDEPDPPVRSRYADD